MKKFINRFTGNAMYVADDRAGEYLAAGHKPAAQPAGAGPEKTAPKKKTAKK